MANSELVHMLQEPESLKSKVEEAAGVLKDINCKPYSTLEANLLTYCGLIMFCCTGVFQLVVQKSRRESAHARPFGGTFELKILRMRGFSSRFLDNQLENPCTCFQESITLKQRSVQLPA